MIVKDMATRAKVREAADHGEAYDRETDEYRKAHWKQRKRALGQLQAMERERQTMQADAQQNLGVHLARTYAPDTFDMITRHPRHGTNAVDPFEGSEVQRMLDGGCANCSDTIIADAGLTVHGAGFLSYPGEGLVKDGLSYVANAVHNI